MQSILFQAAKLGDMPQLLAELEWAIELDHQDVPVERVYGVSGGSLVALAFALVQASRCDPERWLPASAAFNDFLKYLTRPGKHHIHALNLDPRYGFYNLKPLRTWLASRLAVYAAKLLSQPNQPRSPAQLMLSELPVRLYLAALDYDGTFSLFGPENDTLQFQYMAVRVGPPSDAPILDAIIAALSTMLSTEPALVNGALYRDCRPAIVNASAIVADLEANAPRPILHRPPYAPIRPWKQNWITSSFIMHSQNERNQSLLAGYYLDLLDRQRSLQNALQELNEIPFYPSETTAPESPIVGHVDLPYIGSTEAATNMRQSVEQKVELMRRFREILNGQLDYFPFNQPANVIYGAGGFSGILAGLITTGAVDKGFKEQGGQVRQVYGVSAGVLNGFFHAVQLAAESHPDLYKPPARQALNDLENFIAHLTQKQIVRINRNPIHFWQGWANLGPLEEFLLDRLAAYTGSRHPQQITFDDIALPMTVTAARRDGFTEFMGMTQPDRKFKFAGRAWQVLAAPVVKAMLAGWSMNTYIRPTRLGDQTYTDGGGTFYDPGLFVALFDPQLTNLLNIHLDEPEGHSYHLPPRPNLVRIIFDTHNYAFPEERRRMRLLTDLLYEHFRLIGRYNQRLAQLPETPNHLKPQPRPDFRREWNIPTLMIGSPSI